jgi:oxygen-independent coproporphyrinogen-3 oxidase
MIKSNNFLPGLYVHIPFCQSKCSYCDFYSITLLDFIPTFLEALDKEAGIYHDYFASFNSLYLGGGTPSLLTGEQLDTLTKSLRRHFEFAPDTEFSLEANPDDVTPGKLRLWRDLGINRLSLGVQTFNEKELVFLQRRHTARQTRAALEMIRAAGFDNLGLDLMYGLPGQSAETWLKTLKTALGFGPKHLSCYQLTVEAGGTPALRTPFGRLAARGELSLPDEEAQREFFLLTHHYLEDRGYRHYEVANFARRKEPQAGGPGHYYCRHNLKYWRHVPYLGLGPAAHSFRQGRRWWNFSSVAQYCAALDAGRAPVADGETLTPEQNRLESLYLGFRTREGVGLEVIRQQPGWQAVLEDLQERGLVQVGNGRVTPTPQGLVVADRLPLLFVD